MASTPKEKVKTLSLTATGVTNLGINHDRTSDLNQPRRQP